MEYLLCTEHSGENVWEYQKKQAQQLPLRSSQSSKGKEMLNIAIIQWDCICLISEQKTSNYLGASNSIV